MSHNVLCRVVGLFLLALLALWVYLNVFTGAAVQNAPQRVSLCVSVRQVRACLPPTEQTPALYLGGS